MRSLLASLVLAHSMVGSTSSLAGNCASGVCLEASEKGQAGGPPRWQPRRLHGHFIQALQPSLEKLLQVRPGDKGLFLNPNERCPIAQKALLLKAPPGVMIAVGGDRAFMAAAMAPQISHVLMVDQDMGVVRFNRINTALLVISSDLEDYRYLRLRADAREWRERAQASALLDADSLALLSDRDIFRWFDRKRIVFSPKFTEPAKPRSGHSDPVPFAEANYLFHKDSFARLQTLARNDRLQSIHRDLNGNLAEIAEALKAAKLQLAVFDVSNAWWADYLGIKDTLLRFFELRSVSNAHTLLLGSDEVEARHAVCRFGYRALSLGAFEAVAPSLRARTFVKTFLKKAPSGLKEAMCVFNGEIVEPWEAAKEQLDAESKMSINGA